MRTLRVSNRVYRQLTRLLGKLITQSGIMKTFNDVVEDLVSRRVLLPPEIHEELQRLILQAKSTEEFEQVLDTFKNGILERIRR